MWSREAHFRSFKNFHQFQKTCFEAKLSNMEQQQKIQLQGAFIASMVSLEDRTKPM